MPAVSEMNAAMREGRQQMKEFKMPEILSGSVVLVSGDPHFKNPIPGIVVSVKSRTIDVIGIGEESLPIYRDCWHRNDPNNTFRVGAFEGRRDTKGTWDFGPHEARLRKIERDFADLVSRFEGMETTLAETARRTTKPKAE